MPMSVVVVDDEAHARRRVTRLLAEEPDCRVVAECATGREAVSRIREQGPDVVFLDVQMPGLDGFGVLRELGTEALPAVVFVTAFDEHAVEAFRHHVLDYLVKPFEDERFRRCLGRVRERLRRQSETELADRIRGLLADVRPSGPPRSRDRGSRETFAVRTGDRIHLVNASEIRWVEAAGDHVRLHAGDRSPLMRATLSEMEERLAPRGFLRVHRSALVRLDSVNGVRTLEGGGYELEISGGTRIRVGRTYTAAVREALGLDGE
jgi:two-component system LytT family response regulator